MLAANDMTVCRTVRHRRDCIVCAPPLQLRPWAAMSVQDDEIGLLGTWQGEAWRKDRKRTPNCELFLAHKGIQGCGTTSMRRPKDVAVFRWDPEGEDIVDFASSHDGENAGSAKER